MAPSLVVQTLPSAPPSQVLLLDECVHYHQYAIAAYGWMLNLFMHPASSPCRLPALAATYPCTDACEAAAPTCAAAACACSPACRAASAASPGGCVSCEATAATAAAAAALVSQLDPATVSARAHYLRGPSAPSPHSGLPADRVCCTGSDGDALGLGFVALRWTVGQANEVDALDRERGGGGGDRSGSEASSLMAGLRSGSTTLLSPLIVLGGGAASVPVLSNRGAAASDAATAQDSPPSAWAADAAAHTPGAPKAPVPPPPRPTMPFHRSDILHASLGNVLAATPWFVAVDRGRRALVVAVRGTISIDDAITDALAVPLCVGGELGPTLAHLAARDGVVVPPASAYAHAGMWHAAAGIKRALLKHGLLETAAGADAAAGGGGSTGSAKTAAPPLPAAAAATACGGPHAKGLRGLQLVVVGHSLGAGVASLLALQVIQVG